MAGLGFTRIVVSIPRLICGAVLVGVVIGAVQLNTTTEEAQTLQSKPTSVKAASAPYTVAPQTVTQSSPTAAAPEAEVVSPKPTVTAPVAVSAIPAPVVTPSSSANVSGLALVGPITASNSGASSNRSSATSSAYTSTNWSGYFATTGNYIGISGSWVVPRATAGGSSSASDVTWIGIGGVTSKDLIQVGTEDTFTHAGAQKVSAFYEMMPGVLQPIPTLTVSPGDTIVASLSETSPNQWKISISDSTARKSYTNTVTYASSRSSVEWIEEDPSNKTNVPYPLDSFGTVSFTDATTNTSGEVNTLAANDAQSISMITGSTGTNEAIPSAINGSGDAFTITRR